MEYTFYSILLCFMIFVLFWCVPPDARYIGAVTMEQSTDRDSSAYRYHIICYIHICPWLFSISKHMHMLMVGCVGYFFIIKKNKRLICYDDDVADAISIACNNMDTKQNQTIIYAQCSYLGCTLAALLWRERSEHSEYVRCLYHQIDIGFHRY